MVHEKDYTVKELRVIAKEKGLKGYHKLKKLELMDRLGLKIGMYDKLADHKRKITVYYLQKLCKEKGIRGYTRKTKSELLKKCMSK